VTFTSHLTPKAHAQVMRALALRNPVNWILAGWGPAFGIGWLLTRAPLAQRWTLIGFASLAIAVAGQWLIQSYLAWSPASAELYQPVRVVAGDDGLRLTGEGYDNLAGWDDFGAWRRVGDVLLIYRHPRGYIALMPRDLAPDEGDALKELLARHLGRERRT
jgi:hypothetical protein